MVYGAGKDSGTKPPTLRKHVAERLHKINNRCWERLLNNEQFPRTAVAKVWPTADTGVNTLMTCSALKVHMPLDEAQELPHNQPNSLRLNQLKGSRQVCSLITTDKLNYQIEELISSTNSETE